jgi:AmmeMemoRadiSam system protein B
MSRVRDPAVAGRFYEAAPERLNASLGDCFTHPLGPGKLPEVAVDGGSRMAALVSPHAGYMYSGPAAAHGFAALAADGIPETVVILGPSHYSSDRRAALSTADAWRTPLGDVYLDTPLGEAILAKCDLVVGDERPHKMEHSLEVQVPFLQFVYGDRTPKICPICVRSYPMYPVEEVAADARAIGEALTQALAGRRAVIIASTDLSHQMPQETAERLDRMAIEAALAVDPGRLLETVVRHDITMCGPAPVAIALAYCRAVGRVRAELLRYYTSGDITGDRAGVVGYASLAVGA